MTTVAGVIIGDEILSGKVGECNCKELIELCRETGATLCRVSVIGDEIETIADEIRRSAANHDVVVSSGGLGPTHDDRTVAGVARAFDLDVVRNPELAALIRELWGERFTDAALRMADIPEGSRLVHGTGTMLPMVKCRNVYLLPGIPKLFAIMLPWIRRDLSGPTLVLSSLYLNLPESTIAPQLSEVDARFPTVKIGSYPRLWVGDHTLWITFEGHDGEQVHQALHALLDLLPSTGVVRIEEGH